MRSLLRIPTLALTLWGGLAASAVGAGAQDTPLTPAAGDALEDGPHVYWRDDRTALAFYHCRGEFMASGWFEVRSAVNLTGLCSDSTSTYTLSARPPRVEPDRFDRVERIFTVSDIHGEYDGLVELLRNAGVVDDRLAWAWGEGHLVIAGDVLDRGAKVTECLWLVHRLEQEAREAGGRVHYLLGNHEVMVMQGDLRYVNQRYMKGVVASSGVDYQDLFGPAMEMGRWLRTRNTVVRLNGILFLHGGLGPGVVERDLDVQEINEQVRSAIDLRSYDYIFNDMPGFLLASDGPLWYRGYHRDMGATPQSTPDELSEILKHFDASAVVVGHTDVGRVASLYGGKAFGVDVDFDALGGLEGLLWEGGAFYRVTADGTKEALGGS